MNPLNKYLNTVDNKYYKCHISCGTCSNAIVCTSCNHNLPDIYHWKDANKNECIKEADKEPATYLDEENDVYLQCYVTCSSYNKGGDENNNNCDRKIILVLYVFIFIYYNIKQKNKN
jgi:hypothetical protein